MKEKASTVTIYLVTLFVILAMVNDFKYKPADKNINVRGHVISKLSEKTFSNDSSYYVFIYSDSIKKLLLIPVSYHYYLFTDVEDSLNLDFSDKDFGKLKKYDFHLSKFN